MIGLAGGVPEVVGWALATLGARIEPVPLDELLGRGENRVGDWAHGTRSACRDRLRCGRTSPSPDPRLSTSLVSFVHQVASPASRRTAGKSGQVRRPIKPMALQISDASVDQIVDKVCRRAA